ncbi:MAG: ferritin-like domain-containing protein [Pyrinomonadaceae bacterium]|nr:ferritin-like domain-containing protein [Pyrinomonadaceae bacterium]
MKFETKQDVLNWYEKQPRTLTKEFISQIPWHEVKNYPLDKKFVPVLLYMRDVEVLTDMYYEELRRTPTGKDSAISKFMERWGVEEVTHGEVIDRFLNEAGIETSRNWKTEVRQNVPKFYTFNTRIITTLTNLIGKKFTATHMTFGAIHEMSTGQGYRRLMKMANHPVLTEILTAILREESAHTKFYLSVAKIELQKSEFARQVSRFIVNNFWSPVGQGAKPKFQTDYTIGTLFSGAEGLDWIERNVSQKIQSLPGFRGLNTISERVKAIVTPPEIISV